MSLTLPGLCLIPSTVYPSPKEEAQICLSIFLSTKMWFQLFHGRDFVRASFQALSIEA